MLNRPEEFKIKNILVVETPHCTIWGDNGGKVSINPNGDRWPMVLDHLWDALFEYSFQLKEPQYIDNRPQQLDLFEDL